MKSLAFAPAAVLSLVALAGCGGSTQSASPTTTTTTAGGATTNASGSATGAPGKKTPGPSALQAEANATAAGDIPDNQVFLTFRDTVAGYSMKYPEGWVQRGSGNQVTLRNVNNIVRVVVAPGTAPTAATVRADLAGLKGATVEGSPRQLTLAGKPAYKITYETESAPNPVTGKRVKLVVDRYYLARGDRRAVVDLGTPVGVDNVDAYRMMIESFGWS